MKYVLNIHTPNGKFLFGIQIKYIMIYCQSKCLFRAVVVFSNLLFVLHVLFYTIDLLKTYTKDCRMMLDGAKVYTTKDNILSWVPSIIIIPVAYYFFSQFGTYTLIDNFDLIIHEAGTTRYFPSSVKQFIFLAAHLCRSLFHRC